MAAQVEKVVKAGWLEKEGHIAKSWKRRFFVLQGCTLSYYETSDTSGKALGVIHLHNCTVSEPKSHRSGRFAWRISTPDGKESKFILAADSVQLMDEWKEAIRIQSSITRTRAGTAPANPTSTGFFKGLKIPNRNSLFGEERRPTMIPSVAVAAEDDDVAMSSLGLKLLGWVQYDGDDDRLDHFLELFDAADQEKVVPGIVRMRAAHGSILPLLRRLGKREVDSTVQEATLLRRNSVATRCFNAYTLHLGQRHLKKTLEHSLTYVTNLGKRIEVDPARMEQPVSAARLDEARRLLNIAAQQVLDAIISNGMEHCELRTPCREARLCVATKFPDSALKIVGAILFLRFFVPAVIAPDSFGVLSPPISIAGRRALVLVAKLLQNLANGVEFGSKEEFLIPMNPFIVSNAETMRHFLKIMSSDDTLELITMDDGGGESFVEEDHTVSDVQIKEDINYLFKCTLRIKDKVNALASDTGCRVQQAMQELSAMLEPMARLSSQGAKGRPSSVAGFEEGGVRGQDRTYWQRDEECDICLGCTVPFSVSIRKHHCRRCGLVFCATCVRFTAKVPERKRMKESRVCKDCLESPVAESKWIDAKLVWKADAVHAQLNVPEKGLLWTCVKKPVHRSIESCRHDTAAVTIKGEEVYAFDLSYATDIFCDLAKRKQWDYFMQEGVECLGYGGPRLRVLSLHLNLITSPQPPASSAYVICIAESLRRVGPGMFKIAMFPQYALESLRRNQVVIGSPTEITVQSVSEKLCKVAFKYTANASPALSLDQLEELLVIAMQHQLCRLKMMEVPDLLVDDMLQPSWPKVDDLRRELARREELACQLGWSREEAGFLSCSIESQSELSGDEVYLRASTHFECSPSTVSVLLWPLEAVSMWDNSYRNPIMLLETFAAGEVITEFSNESGAHLLYRREHKTEDESRIEVCSMTPSYTRGAVFIDKILVERTAHGCVFVRTVQFHSGGRDTIEWAKQQRRKLLESMDSLSTLVHHRMNISRKRTHISGTSLIQQL